MGSNLNTSEKSNKNIMAVAQEYLMQAEKLRKKNKYKESVENYLHSIMINRSNPDSYLGLAISYKNLELYEKAISALKKAEQYLPESTAIKRELAICNILNGNECEGMPYLMKAIKAEPNNLDIQMQLALVHEMIHEDEMALMIYQKIIETNPEYIRAYIQKATLYMHLEDYLNSAKAFAKIIKLAPDYYRAYLALGICYEKLNNLKGAKRYYKKYLSFDKAEKNYKKVVKRINNLTTNQNRNVELRIV